MIAGGLKELVTENFPSGLNNQLMDAANEQSNKFTLYNPSPKNKENEKEIVLDDQEAIIKDE